MNSIKHLEYEQCRTCYDSTSNLQLLTSIAESGTSQADGKTYMQLLSEVCNINVMEDKPLGYWPPFICFNCCHKLKLAHDFIHQTRKINQLLKSIADILEIKNKRNFIEKPELDIPLDTETENDDTVDVLPNERSFQYSPIQSEVIKTESTIVTYDKLENVPSNNCKEYAQNNIIMSDNENSKKIIIPSAIEFANNDLITYNNFDNLPKDNTINIDSRKSNSNADLTCYECKKLFSSIHTFNRHMRFTHISEENKISCPICNFKFSRSYHLKRHLRTVHKPNKRPTKNTAKNSKISKTVTSSTCNKNTKASSDVSVLTGSVCQKIFNTSKKLSRHKRLVHVPEEKQITCRFCDKKFERTDQYERHMKYIHDTDVLPQKNLVEIKGIRYFCDKCDCSYTRRYRLYQHKRKVHG